jgi:hypothetical protein
MALRPRPPDTFAGQQETPNAESASKICQAIAGGVFFLSVACDAATAMSIPDLGLLSITVVIVVADQVEL